MSNEDKTCADCKHLSPVVTQIADYYCYKKGEYTNNIYAPACEHFKLTNTELTEKEDKIWG